ncbi:MAG: Cof-type HAD-IIB family hydrolase [Eubacteriales bacterium]|nr:Cof-type HAD-IIB family hydrolase [Eubacteriales bacterium]
MSEYKLIALDMDGTLLNSEKVISDKTVEMIRKAAREGKEIVLSTGRCLAELREHLDRLPEVRYLNCVSGAVVYDCLERKVIYSRTLSVEEMKKVLELSKMEDVMVHMLYLASVVDTKSIARMEEFGMGVYRPMFEQVTEKHEDMYQWYEASPIPVGKCNLYHLAPECRSRTEERLKEAHMEVSAVYSEKTSLEITAKDVNKGTGLLRLCGHLGIRPEEVIAVGDNDNDVDMLKVAGLAVAMGNASDEIKELSDVVVADCDHDGCAQAIEEYLLA